MNKQTINSNAIRHGEILILPVDKLPENVEEIFSGNEYIVGHSETGHHHVAVANVTVYRPVGGDSTDIYLRANKPGVIEHQKSFDKHETKTLNPGLYLVRPKNEYDPFAKLIRQVRD